MAKVLSYPEWQRWRKAERRLLRRYPGLLARTPFEEVEEAEEDKQHPNKEQTDAID